MQETERQLTEAIRAGDWEALQRLYERFSRYAMGIALRYVSERDNALDVVQDSFVSILTSIGSFEYRGEGSLKSWVSKIVANQAIYWVKRHELLSFTELPSEETASEKEDEVEDTPFEKVPLDVLNKMIGRLPARYRIIVNLHVFEELPHREIARQLGIKEKTSVSQFSRARRKLAEMIKEYLNSQRI